MSQRRCLKCGFVWPGDKSPFCPSCKTYDWAKALGFISPKHDPSLLPNIYRTARSVITYDFIQNKGLYISTIANQGEFYYDTKWKNFSCVLNQPLGTTAGSAIPANYPWPTHPLDSQIIVGISDNPHVYAKNLSSVRYEIAQGRLIPSIQCNVPACYNLAIPGTTKCQMH